MNDGELSVEEASTGEFRWSYVTTGGANFLGPKLYDTKGKARAAGKKWLTEQQRQTKGR